MQRNKPMHTHYLGIRNKGKFTKAILQYISLVSKLYTNIHSSSFSFLRGKDREKKKKYFVLKCDLCIRLIENLEINMPKHLQLCF